MTETITVTKRDTNQSADTLRAEGQLPAVVYGAKREPQAIALDRALFEKLRKDVSESTILTLAGLDEPVEVLLKDVAINPVQRVSVHADFYVVERGTELTANVPLHVTGEAPVEKVGGVVNRVLHEVSVTARPSALPEEIVVDISSLTAVGDRITVADLTLPAGVALDLEPDTVVINAEAVAEEVEHETEVADAPPEVEAEVSGDAESKSGSA